MKKLGCPIPNMLSKSKGNVLIVSTSPMIFDLKKFCVQGFDLQEAMRQMVCN